MQGAEGERPVYCAPLSGVPAEPTCPKAAYLGCFPVVKHSGMFVFLQRFVIKRQT